MNFNLIIGLYVSAPVCYSSLIVQVFFFLMVDTVKF